MADKAAEPAMAAKPAEPGMAEKAADPAMAAKTAESAAAGGATLAEIEDRLKKLLTPEGENAVMNGTHAARVLYARALLARMMKDLPKFENLISIIPDAAKVEELSPLLLSTLAEMLLKKGDSGKAESYFNRIREAYAEGEFGDKAPVGLGRIQLAQKNYGEALKLFDEAISKYPGSSSMLDATIGKAEALFRLKKLPEAKKLYELLFQTREWRGEATAIGLFGLGQIEEENKDWNKAIGYYNRLILSQQKYKPWLAKAYLRCSACWMELSKKEDAVKVLRDMLARKDVTDLPEFAEAQQTLAKISG
jgi:tetratricopeptide (TPR) repeat protein